MNVYEKIKRDLFYVVIVYMLLLWFTGQFDYDSTDGEGRSGLALRIDAMTGCQYLEGSKGGITPRLNNEGYHICE